MKYKITRLDKRHNGYMFYKYSISPDMTYREENIDLLVELRNWCWATFGPSAELGFTRMGDTWAWDTEYKNRRIYLKGDEELTFFTLKYAG
jgi:hypothetical protein